jgi:hypothetical protein
MEQHIQKGSSMIFEFSVLFVYIAIVGFVGYKTIKEFRREESLEFLKVLKK